MTLEMQRTLLRLFMLCLTVALLFGVGHVFAWFFRAIFGGSPRAPIEPEPVDEDAEVEHAIEVLQRPRRVAGGQYMHWKVEAKPCEAPVGASELVVHDRTDASHVATCAECREGRKPRHSGVSYRRAN